MIKLNNKGFTLVEILAVIAILGILATITIPTVGTLIETNKENSMDNLKKSIISAAKIYISDNRYKIKLANDSCEPDNTRNISTINDSSEMFIKKNFGKLKIQTLVDAGNLTTNKDGKILNPIDNKELNLESSYIIVKYDCTTKDYNYQLDAGSLNWQ